MNTIHNENVEHKGHTITINWFHDEDGGAPWKDCDGHGPVSDWTSRDKRPGERLLHSDHNSKRYYDFAAAINQAKKDGWDAEPFNTGTKGEQAVRAVEANFELLRAWCADEWHWAGYTVTIEGMGYEESLWGIDSMSMDQYTKDVLTDAKAWLDRELVESQRAAYADIVTTY